MTAQPMNTAVVLGPAALRTPASEPLKIHFISGSKEYKSEPSLKAFEKHLETKFNIAVTASWVKDGAYQR